MTSGLNMLDQFCTEITFLLFSRNNPSRTLRPYRIQDPIKAAIITHDEYTHRENKGLFSHHNKMENKVDFYTFWLRQLTLDLVV